MANWFIDETDKFNFYVVFLITVVSLHPVEFRLRLAAQSCSLAQHEHKFEWPLLLACPL